ncbi:hypothetical protein Q5P01_007773 [Channa striata]|uniref:STAS domain-containing protein n=1 Tax=Channa striata TaxID=64152 RepID=A0AA88N7E2_CHASR|nr:hypothetical protein Q5P01_007773 [Channa striata]
MAPDSNFLVNGTNGTTVNIEARDLQRIDIAMALTIIMGIYQILLGMFKFGFMVNYLSEPMIRGYTTASAVLVCISQLKSIFGVSPALYSGILSPVRTFINVCQLLPKTRPVEVIITALSLLVLMPVKEMNAYFKNKLTVPIPIELVVVIIGTIITHFSGIMTKYGVSVVGVIPSGFQAPYAPNSNLYGQVAGSAIAIAIVSYTINISLGKTFSRKYGYKVDNNQELLAIGIGNVFGGFFQCYAVTAALSRSLVQETTGGKTQVAGIISSILMLIAILKIGSLFQNLPKAVLAAVVLVNLKGMFVQLVDIPFLWRTNKVDLMVWMVTFIGAIVLNLDVGLALAVGFAILTVIFRTQLPHYSLLGLVPGTDLYLDTETYKEAKEIPGIKIFRSSTTVYYTNAEKYLDALQEKSGIDIRTLLSAKRKQEADLKRQQDKEKKKAEKEAKKQKKLGGHLPSGPFSLKETNDEYYERLRRESQGTISQISLTDTSPHNNGKGQVNWAYQHDPNIFDSVPDKVHQDSDSITQVSPMEDGKGGTHSIILDVSTLSFVDTVTLSTFKNIFSEFGQVDFDVYLAGCQACVVKQLETAGFFSEAIPKTKVFVTVHDAVIFILKKRSQTDLILDTSGNTKMCSVFKLKLILLRWVPVVDWLPHYPIKENILGDVISGCSVAVMHLPQGMAYATLAGLRPVFGLYSSFYPALIYFFFGTSRHISIGTFAVVSIMVGSVVERLAPDSNITVNGTNGTDVNPDALDAYRVQIASSFAVLTGIFQFLLGVVRFGVMVTYLSEPLIRAYTTGSAFLVCASQLKYVFGVEPSRFSGPLSVVYTLVDVCRLLPETRPAEVVVSVVALTVLIVFKEINAHYREKLPLPIPVELILIIVATIVSHFGSLKSKYAIDVVGEIPSGLRAPFAPDVTLFTQMVGDAFAVAVVSYTISISLAKTFALKHGYKVDSNQELVALGLSNTFGGFFQCYSVTASLSRTLVQETTGGKTQVAGVFSSIILLIVILKIGSLFEDLPKAILAAIVIVNLKGMFLQLADIPVLWRTNKVDLLVWLVTFICTILLNLDVGLAAAAGFAILTVIVRTQLPHYSLLGRVPDTDLYLDIEIYQEAKEIPGIKIFRSSTTIYYTNAEMYLEALQEKSGIDIRKLLTAKRKQETELKRIQKKERQKAKEESKKLYRQNQVVGCYTLKDEGRNVSEFNQNSENRLGIGQVNWSYQHDDSIHQVSPPVDEENGGTHSIVLDISTVSFVDTVSVKTLKNIFTEFGEVGLDIYLAGCQVCVVKQLESAGFFSGSITKNRLFVTIHDAVLYILQKRRQTDVSTTTEM